MSEENFADYFPDPSFADCGSVGVFWEDDRELPFAQGEVEVGFIGGKCAVSFWGIRLGVGPDLFERFPSYLLAVFEGDMHVYIFAVHFQGLAFAAYAAVVHVNGVDIVAVNLDSPQRESVEVIGGHEIEQGFQPRV